MKQYFIYPLVLILSFCLLSACGKTEAKTERKIINDTLKVEMTEVRKLHPQKNILLPGELKAWEKVDLYPKVKGFVKQLVADRGTIVKAGQVLAVLEAPEALAEYKGALASLEESKTKLKASQLHYKRLLQTSKTLGAVSEHELEQSYSRVLSDSSLSAHAQENYNMKKHLVDYLTIKAPIDGVIMERNISPGALVGPELSGQKPLFVLVNSSKLRLTVAIPEVYSSSVHSNTVINFSVNSLPDQKFKAKYSRSAENIDNHIRVMMVEFDVPNPTYALKAGMYAEVKIPIQRQTPTLFVPSQSIITSSEKVFVIKIEKGLAKWHEIKKGNTVDTLTEVFGEIEERDAIVKKASEEIRDGQPLRE